MVVTLSSVLQEEAPLLTPDVLICSVGTEIWYRGADGMMHEDRSWHQHLDKDWQRGHLMAAAASMQELSPQVGIAGGNID